MSPFSLDRRSFLAAGLGTLAAPPAPKLLDIHVHLFGVGEGRTGCRMAKSVTNSWTFRLLVSTLGLRKRNKPLDVEYERVLVEHLEGSGMTRSAILGQDAVYRRGKPDWDRTSFYTPNDYVFAVTARHPDLMVPCPSINPDRGDAIEELARCHRLGARLFKIHPPTQGVDVGGRQHTKFFRCCTALDMVVLVHTGHEHSAPVIDKDLASPRRLELALDQGCTVVACHSGSGWVSDRPDQLPEFLALLKRYKNLWGDTAVLGTAGRERDFGRLLDDPLARSRLLHGSDFPFPVSPARFAGRIGADTVRRIGAEASWIRQDYELKAALGIGLASARRAYEVARVDAP
jgi:uncharacterized protein